MHEHERELTTQGGTAIDLLRLRTAANGPVAKVYLTANGGLALRSDFGATQLLSGVALGTGWHEIELCGTVAPHRPGTCTGTAPRS